MDAEDHRVRPAAHRRSGRPWTLSSGSRSSSSNWIGRSTGAEVTFKATTGEDIVVFTTRPDTLFGATYMVLSPEHALVQGWLESGRLKNADAVVGLSEGGRLQV